MKLGELMETKKAGTYAAFRYNKDGVKLISKYAKDNDVPNPLESEKMHTTLLYSRKHCPDYKPAGKLDDPYKATVGDFDVWKTQSGKNALVVELDCPDMVKRHNELMKEHGATHDFDEYKVHITLSYDCGDLDVDKLPDIRDTIKELAAEEEYGEDLKLDWADGD